MSLRLRRLFSLAVLLTAFLTVQSALLRPIPADAGSIAQGSIVQLSPNSGCAGTNVAAVGYNWVSGHNLQVVWADSGQTLTQVTADGRGSFVAYFNVPGNATQGAHTVAVQDTSQLQNLQLGFFIPATFTVTC